MAVAPPPAQPPTSPDGPDPEEPSGRGSVAVAGARTQLTQGFDRAARVAGRVPPDALLALGLGALLAAVALGAGGGLQLAGLTWVELGLEAAGGLLGAVAILTTARQRLHGAATLALFALFAALCAISIVWAVQPDDAWLETNRTLAYFAAFGSGVALVRIAPGRYTAIIGATVIAAVVVSAYALLTKVFPGSLAPDETYARLREPFGYWNAVGLMAALGAPGCLWLGARRHGHAALNALAFPALTLLGLTLLLAFSRGALLALALGCAAWFVMVPLRLRGAGVLAGGAAGTVPLAAWAFSQDALTKDRVLLADRTTTGHELGLLLVVALVLLTVVGLAVGFAWATTTVRRRARRNTGVVLLVLLALVPIGLIVGLALSERGLGGSISKGYRELTDPDVVTQVTNDPGRLTAVGSVRSRYYADSLRLLGDHPLQGSGAGGFATARPRVREDELDVRHSHGYVFQVAADLGALGLLATAALLGAFLWAAGQACAVLRGPGAGRAQVDAELVALRTLAAVVVVFGVSSFVDWTWFIPGNAVPALLCAGWLAGRGPAVGAWGSRSPRPGITSALREGLRDRGLVAGAAALLVVTVLVGWTSYQPKHAIDVGDGSLSALDAGDVDRARAEANEAADIDPLSLEPYFDLAVIEGAVGRFPAERAALEAAVKLQPQNPTPWLRLAEFEATRGEAQRSLNALGPALYLDPRNSDAVTLFLDQSRRAGTTTPPAGSPATP